MKHVPTQNLIRRVMKACEREDHPTAIRQLRRVIRRLPDRPDLWALLGDLQLGEELYAPAAASFRRGLALLAAGARPLAAGPPDPAVPDAAALHLALGTALARSGDLAGAETAMRQAVSLRPVARHLVALGELLEGRGRRQEALAAFRAALEETSDHPEALYRLGCWHMWTEPREAEAYFRRALEGDPRHARAMCALGHLLAERDAEEEGVAWLRRAVRSGRAGALPHVYLGHSAWKQGRMDEAESAYRQGMEADPGDPHPWFALGDLDLARNRPQAARRAYEEALRVDPGCGDAVLRMAWLDDTEGRPAEALEGLRRGLTLAPQHPWRDDVRARIAELKLAGGA